MFIKYITAELIERQCACGAPGGRAPRREGWGCTCPGPGDRPVCFPASPAPGAMGLLGSGPFLVLPHCGAEACGEHRWDPRLVFHVITHSRHSLSPGNQCRLVILSLGWWSPSPPSQTFLDSPLGLLPQPFPCVASKELRLCQTGSSWIQLRPLSSLDWLFNILMSSLWLPLCNLSPVVLLALYRGGGLSSLSIQHFPVAKRLTGESSPWVAG